MRSADDVLQEWDMNAVLVNGQAIGETLRLASHETWLAQSDYSVTPCLAVWLLALIKELNADDSIYSNLVQLPSPVHMVGVFETIDPATLPALNVGRLPSGRPAVVTCTPLRVVHKHFRE